jgi:hypothetical protein
VAGQPLYIDDILAAVRERRIGAATAAAWLELRLAEQARQVRAHATPAPRDRVVNALDAAPTGDGGDEFARLFPPSAPLGPELGHEEYRPEPLIYPGEEQGRRNRRGVTWDGYTSASARPAPGEMTNEEAAALFPPRTAEEAERRAQTVEARAARVEAMSDDELYERLFPPEFDQRTAED